MKEVKFLVTILIMSLLLATPSAYAQLDSLQAGRPLSTLPRFRGAQIDVSTLLLLNTVAAAGDVDFIRVKMGKDPTFFGLRISLQRIQALSFHSSVYGSPFFDRDLLVRLSTAGPSMRVDSYIGYSYRSSFSDKSYPSGGQIKFGMDWAWTIGESVDLFLRLALVKGSFEQASPAGFGLRVRFEP